MTNGLWFAHILAVGYLKRCALRADTFDQVLVPAILEVALLLPAALPPSPPAVAQAAARVASTRGAQPTYMLLYAREYHLNPSRRVVPVGRVVIQVVNIGEDPHDVALRDPQGREISATPIIRSRKRFEWKMRLSRVGRYTLWCRVPGHLDHGMSTTFVVKKPVRRL